MDMWRHDSRNHAGELSFGRVNFEHVAENHESAVWPAGVRLIFVGGLAVGAWALVIIGVSMVSG